ncbi:MAG: mechanosensitive ion channel family protein [Vicinamibacterales bacterium]
MTDQVPRRRPRVRTSAWPPAASRPASSSSRRTARATSAAYHDEARRQLKRFRQGSALAVGLAALVLVVWGAPVGGQDSAASPSGQATSGAAPVLPVAGDGVGEAAATMRALASGFFAFLPRLVLALLVVAFAVLAVKLTSRVLERTLRGWDRLTAVTAVMRLVAALAVGVVALSILAGDARAAVGSVGLVGLAASWALQTPIESFTGWLLNSFRGYYRVGDRISVGDVFGDVYRIDVLNTTVWEAGGPGKAVTAAQATGAVITFPNWEVLRSNIVNYSRDFPYVWDELTIGVANESDLAYCAGVLRDVARRVLGDEMAEAARRYQELLMAERLTFGIEEVPVVYFSSNASWTDCAIRYLVPVRARRAWASRLLVEIGRELGRAEHARRIVSVYPRSEVRLRESWTPPPEQPRDA